MTGPKPRKRKFGTDVSGKSSVDEAKPGLARRKSELEYAEFDAVRARSIPNRSDAAEQETIRKKKEALKRTKSAVAQSSFDKTRMSPTTRAQIRKLQGRSK